MKQRSGELRESDQVGIWILEQVCGRQSGDTARVLGGMEMNWLEIQFGDAKPAKQIEMSTRVCVCFCVVLCCFWFFAEWPHRVDVAPRSKPMQTYNLFFGF